MISWPWRTSAQTRNRLCERRGKRKGIPKDFLGWYLLISNLQNPIPIVPFLRILARGIRCFNQTVGIEQELPLLNLIDSHCGNRQKPGFKAFHPTLGLEVPQEELDQFERSAEEAGNFVSSYSRTVHVAPALNVQK